LATVVAYAIPIAVILAFPWWPAGAVGEIIVWTTLFVLLGACIWYGKRRARRQPAR
jgi:hypothetical protein